MNKIDNIEFHELEAEKYWSFPKSYKKDPKIETKEMIFSGDYIGSRKMDGAYFRFIKDMEGNMSLQGRSRSVKGCFLNKIGHVPQLHKFFESLPNGTCLLGELYFPNNEGSSNVTTIIGCLEEKARARQEKGDKLHYYIFDIWAWGGLSYMNIATQDRFRNVEIFAEEYKSEYVEWAKYYEGERLWEELANILSLGGEGVVITKKGSVPAPGKRTARKTLKIKKELSEPIDCFFTGKGSPPTRLYSGKEIESWKYWENLQTGEKIEKPLYKEYYEGAPIEPVTKPYFYGWAGSLEIGVVKDNKAFPIGFVSGVTDEIKANHQKYKGVPIEVAAMEILPTGGIRHPKFVRFRKDLTLRDCTWEKFMGEE